MDTNSLVNIILLLSGIIIGLVGALILVVSLVSGLNNNGGHRHG